MSSKTKQMIDLNEYSHKELEANVEHTISAYHNNRFKNKTFKELAKIDHALVKMRNSGLSIDYIRKFIMDYFGYKVSRGTLSEYFKTFHEGQYNATQSLLAQ